MSKPRPTLQQLETDEDLDELDDVLSEFTPSQTQKPSSTSTQPPLTSPLTSPPPPPPTATTTTSFNRNRPRTNTRVDQAPRSIPSLGRPLEKTEEDELNERQLEDEFTKELVKNMEELMRELTKEASGSNEANGLDAKGDSKGKGKGDEGKNVGEMSKEEREKEAERLMKAAWEAMLVEGMDGAMNTGDLPGVKADGVGSGGAAGKDDFQAKIRQTMDKLKQSESNLQARSTGANANPDSLESLLASLKDLGLDDLGGENGEDESELADFLENMMGHLMSKDVLYDPLKELNGKFPAYLSNPPESLSAADKKRYEAQYEYIKKILAVFDDPGYDEKNPETEKKITDLMSEMREHGSPPEEIMGPMPPGFGPDGGCVVS